MGQPESEHGTTSAVAAVAPDISANATRTETNFEKAASSVNVVDDAGAVRRISGDQNKHSLRDEVSGPYPLPQSWTPTALRFWRDCRVDEGQREVTVGKDRKLRYYSVKPSLWLQPPNGGDVL